MNEKLAFSIAEVCATANFGRTTAYQFIKTGALRAVKMGRRTVVLSEDLRSFLSNLPSARDESRNK
ncbi:helix-turn-helix domain-containing protein [Bradyrhizobium sp. AUGA SZCCT0177]|uniref:helix-turn-helix domain-containing protein n=1 Tax=Bradyrhizobium sp. AUGA SZCCT0177 TaxID=2807665 RepID=UPI001BA819C5|nr:helix-turn-helix domain-containing protein [Bradyrhizobium sp. AUGA SZCCT0177]MBR1282939.1 helix-turn-helix domain-containing protein [Bradyrhizobium sp. AUGA SZCCT0177]